jgi:Family of unknown function (DUF6294)
VSTERHATPEEINQPPFAVTFSNTVRDPSPLFDSLQSVDFNWDPIFVGHCKLAATTLTVFSDGTAHWRANDVMSTAGDDSWLATFEFFDPHGVSLWRFGHISSPSLSPPFAVITWVNNDQLLFPAYIFPFVARVNLYSHC